MHQREQIRPGASRRRFEGRDALERSEVFIGCDIGAESECRVLIEPADGGRGVGYARGKRSGAVDVHPLHRPDGRRADGAVTCGSIVMRGVGARRLVPEPARLARRVSPRLCGQRCAGQDKQQEAAENQNNRSARSGGVAGSYETTTS